MQLPVDAGDHLRLHPRPRPPLLHPRRGRDFASPAVEAGATWALAAGLVGAAAEVHVVLAMLMATLPRVRQRDLSERAVRAASLALPRHAVHSALPLPQSRFATPAPRHLSCLRRRFAPTQPAPGRTSWHGSPDHAPAD
eukprot:5130719-Prymnesium_polylepis.1